MECVVEGQEVSLEELSDGSWQQRRATAYYHVNLPAATFAAIEGDQCLAISAPPANLRDLPPASRNTVPIRPVNNTFTLSVAYSAKAQAHLGITSLIVSCITFTVYLYVSPPDDILRGILYHAFNDFTDEAVLEDLWATTCAPIHDGIGTTVAPLHIPRPLGARRLMQTSKTLPPANRSSSHQPADAAPTLKNAMTRGTERPPKLPLPPAKTTAVFPSLAVTAPKAASQTLSVVLPRRSTSAVLAAGRRTAAEKRHSTTTSRRTAPDRLSPLPSSTASASDMDTQPADECVGKHKRQTTPLKSLHLFEKIQAAIKTAQADFERRLDSRFNFVHQLQTPCARTLLPSLKPRPLNHLRRRSIPCTLSCSRASEQSPSIRERPSIPCHPRFQQRLLYPTVVITSRGDVFC
ncbi:hypothetical protein HPB52_009417 [Rhipicephalus sanguineus]|uniref:Uncharacterized protein n=1 Tax=Rhipicephalus sanguineus TaxID=34632 RepID=A0A9D4SQN1_RHISA|nr:hypothetical protein HPB52_009417 [Rhipicephalus sanguineus]